MKQGITTLVGSGVLALALIGIAVAGPREDVQSAYQHGDYAAAKRLLRLLAEQGDAIAQFNLGGMYYFGRGVPQDYAEALAWYRKGAEQGDADSQSRLGAMYHQGQGVPQDYGKALVWFRKAAEQGQAVAQSSLGELYAEGRGVPRDYALAHMWFNLAASREENVTLRQMAVQSRDEVAAKMTPARIAEAQRMAREWMQSHPSTR
jgi:TPR repeat protein